MWFNVLALILVNVIQNNEKRILTHYIPIIYIYIILMSYFIQKHGKVIIIIINDDILIMTFSIVAADGLVLGTRASLVTMPIKIFHLKYSNTILYVFSTSYRIHDNLLCTL